MTQLDGWLKRATRSLSRDSAAQVRTEIREHHESAWEAALRGGASAEEADRLAVTALGDASTANCQYRQVLLTSAEAKMLRDAKWEGRAVCSRGMKRVVPVAPVVVLIAAAAFYLGGATVMARVLVAAGVGLGLLAAAMSLPVYTPSRGRVFRWLKWAVLVAMFVLAFGPEGRKSSWLVIPSLTPLLWIEFTRASIRRKLPVAQWPKALYL